jgi:hypothetical protein
MFKFTDERIITAKITGTIYRQDNENLKVYDRYEGYDSQ